RPSASAPGESSRSAYRMAANAEAHRATVSPTALMRRVWFRESCAGERAVTGVERYGARTCEISGTGILRHVAEHTSPETIRTLLTETHTWAVIGCSPDPGRDSHRIARLLQDRGFRVIPVNPKVTEVLGERCFPSLAAIPETERIDVVDIFRRADRAGAHVDEAIAAGARAVWVQLGVI